MQPDAPEAIVLRAIEKATISRRARARWLATARPEQITPAGEWEVWLILAGRGWGKTRTGAEDVSHYAMTNPGVRIALIGPTAGDVRDVMVEGESGILALGDEGSRPTFEPSKRRVTWPNGSQAACYSAEEPERLRGPQHHRAWADEVGAWENQKATWDQLTLGLRLGVRPQVVVTTTPRPTPLIRTLRAAAGGTTHLTIGRTDDNANNLAPTVLRKFHNLYGGTRLGRQELDGELLEDVAGALWTRDMNEEARPDGPLPAMRRVVIGVDPSGSNGETGDLIGMIAAGLGRDGRGYVLEDGSELLSPEGWASKVAALYGRHGADRVVAERNFGGDMVAAVLRGAAPNLPVTMVTASRGKAVRAEPVAALYEQGKVTHAVPFPELEDQLQGMTPRGYFGPGRSPDRMDALVWALTDLMLGDQQEFDIEEYLRAYGATDADIERHRAAQAELAA